MKNKIIMLLSAALLLTSISAFAKEITSQKTDIMNKPSVNEAVKNSLQKAYEENKAKGSNPEEEIKKICKNDKYCIEAGTFFLFVIDSIGVDGSDVLSEEVLESLKDVKNYKQSLYLVKYTSSINSLRHYLIDFEASKLEKLTEFDEIKAYILDMPMPYSSFIKALNKMKATASSKKELDFVDSFMNKYTGKLFPQNYEKFKEEDVLELIKSSNPFCPGNLIVDNYGYDNLCILPFQTAIRVPSNFNIKEPSYIKTPHPYKIYKEENTKEEPKEETEEMIAAYFK